jgi:hypothetical protein
MLLHKLAYGFLAGAIACTVTGCDTGHTNKQHSSYETVSDLTTTGKQDVAFKADGSGQPPVPGSPTAAGPDGKQPYDDSQARVSLGSEEGLPIPPHQHHKDAFERQ